MDALIVVYLSGSVVAVAVELVRLAFAVFGRWSTVEQNLRLIGATQDRVTREVVFDDESGFGSVILALFLASILSWVSPVWQAVQLLRGIWANVTAPPEVKLLRWRMRHVRLTRLDVALNCIRMREVLSGRPPPEEEREQLAVEYLCALAKKRRLAPDLKTHDNLKFAEGVVGRPLTPPERLRLVRRISEWRLEEDFMSALYTEFDADQELARQRREAADQMKEIADRIDRLLPEQIPLLESHRLSQKLDEAAKGELTHEQVLEYIDDMSRRLSSKQT